jgi:hypothetical protein
MRRSFEAKVLIQRCQLFECLKPLGAIIGLVGEQIFQGQTALVADYACRQRAFLDQANHIWPSDIQQFRRLLHGDFRFERNDGYDMPGRYLFGHVHEQARRARR